jgi:hypothetical protein
MVNHTENDCTGHLKAARRGIAGRLASAAKRGSTPWVLVTLLAVACGVEEHANNSAVNAPVDNGGGISGSTSGGVGDDGGTAGTSGSGSSGGGSSSSSSGGASSDDASSTLPTSDAGAPPPSEGGPPLSGIMVDINGTMVPKEKVIAFIHLGHSNMAGRGGGPPASRPYFFTDKDPHAWLYRNTFQPALEPFTAGDELNGQPSYPGQQAPVGGPGTPLVKQAAGMAPGYYFLSLGYGKESAYCSQYLPGHLYYDAMIQNPKALVGKVTFGAIVIMLGITERHGTAQDITGYPQCINQLVTNIRNDVKEPNLPLLLTDFEMLATDVPANSTFGQQIIPQIHMVPSVVSNSAIVPTDNNTPGTGTIVMLPPPTHHFDLEGHRVWTQRALNIMKQKGWFPWGP